MGQSKTTELMAIQFITFAMRDSFSKEQEPGHVDPTRNGREQHQLAWVRLAVSRFTFKRIYAVTIQGTFLYLSTPDKEYIPCPFISRWMVFDVKLNI